MKTKRQGKLGINAKGTQAQPFMGEIMTCAMCGKSEKSDPNHESQWTAVDLDTARKYICPRCFGNVPGYVFRT